MTFSPIARMSFSMALLTLSILLTGDLFFGVNNDGRQDDLKVRQRVIESLAVQFSSLIAVNDMETIRLTLRNLVLREQDVVSAALRNADGRVRAEAGNHRQQWQDIPFGKSTLTHTQVSIFKNKQRWGSVEIRFADAIPKTHWEDITSPFVLLAGYMFLAGFLGYLFFLRRTLKHLDPGAVIPDRVKTAMDVLTEGVILIDEKEQVVLANTAFSDKLGIASEDLLGKKLSVLGWTSVGTEQTDYPWQIAMTSGESQVGMLLQLTIKGDDQRTFMVNSSPILSEKGRSQGALATFDDVTELEEKNRQLRDMVGDLKLSRDEVSRRNQELQLLAERDALTDCLNRRAFFERAEAEFTLAEDDSNELCIVMLDIDHFKLINDNYGHGVGDEVIKNLAKVLRAGLRGNEVVGRYGGEEFCILMPNTGIDLATTICERLRQHIETEVRQCHSALERTTITASFGISSSTCGANSTGKLVDQADQALYISKDSGRNRVTCWDQPERLESTG
ncbi:MAG: GGDEF domain-containing protein [Gammaproteobacteria bacterium]|nr:GGDEF domain-containing protein [Gammaproteobacteria bacterium]